MDFLLQKIEQILRYQKRWKKWQKVVASLACIVVFITTYALILPAITMDRDEAQSQGGIFWEDMQEAEETVASADAQGADQDGILSAEEANLIAGSELDVSEEQAEMDVVGEENSAGEGTLNPEAASERPAAIFDEVAGDVTVHVEAPEGAFPVGTTMKVEPVADEQVMDAVQSAVEDPVTKVSAVDIIFLDASGNEIEPAAEIKVSMSSSVMENVEQPVIVHVDEEGVGETVESEQVDGGVVFESDRFSVYVMVGTETITVEHIDHKGTKYEVTVTYGADAKIPEGSWLRVTDIEEGTEEYTYARNAVLADKKEKGEAVDLNDFNLAALDISIIDPEGNEIEPEASVQVDIKIKELPGVEDLEKVKNTLEIDHHVEVSKGVVLEKVFEGKTEGTFDMATTEEVVKDGTVVDPNKVSEEDFKATENDDIEVSFNVDRFSTFTIRWSNNYRDVTVHYGYLDDSNVFHEFTEQPSPGLDANYYYHLTYDFDGYSYFGVYRNPSNTSNPTTGTKIGPLLQVDNSGYYQNLRYKTVSNTGSVGSWSNLSDNDNIYVVYKAKVETEGGSPKPSTDETWPDDTPTFSKSSINNGDGTNTITLSIEAAEKAIQNQTKANVIVVFDVSGSMNRNMAGTQEYTSRTAAKMNHNSRLWIAANAVNILANNMMTGEKAGLVQMALISFSDTATTVQDFTTNYSTFSSKVNGLQATGGTNWEGALALANSMTVPNDSSTFVVFVTDGDPTVRMSRGNLTDRQLNDANNQSENLSYKDVDDGDQYYVRYGIYGTGTHDNNGLDYSFAQSEVSAIKDKNKNFYAIGVSNDVSKVRTLVTSAGIGADHAFIATNTTQMTEAFDSIAESINATLGFGDIEITDGITALTNAEMKVMQTVDPNSFKYYRYGGEGNKYGADEAHKTEWTTREADGCEAASYSDSDGAVHWDMGETFQLEDGVTYVVTFTVWPKQEAYDLVADLNNGVKTYGSLTDAEKAQIQEDSEPEYDSEGNITKVGTYSLKTNTDEVNATYNKTTKSGDVVSISDTQDLTATYKEGTIQNMSLASQLLTIKKIFDQSLDPRTVGSVTLKVQRKVNDDDHTMADYNVPGTNSPLITLSDDNNWEYSFYVAPGFILNGETLEKGYQFTVTEPEEYLGDNTVRYDLIQETVNPMVVDGTLTLIGDTDSNQTLTAINRTRSAIEIHKTLYDVDGTTEIYPDTEFTITGKLLAPDGTAYKNQAEGDPAAYYLYDKDGNVKTGRLHFADSSNISFTLKAGEFIRFVNVPEGCTFEFTETSMPDNYEFKSLAAVGRQRNPDTDPAYTYSIELADEAAHLVEDSTKISTTSEGIIGNTNYKLDFYNKRTTPLPNVDLLKVDASDNTLKLNDAEFELHKDSAEGEVITLDGNGKTIAIKTGNKTDSTGPDGWYNIGYLPAGTYYLVETAAPANHELDTTPVIITVTKETNSYTVTATKDGTSVISGPTDGTYTITVDNELSSRNVTILKTTESGKSQPLAGAIFDLYTKEGYEANPRADAIQTGIESSAVEGKTGQLALGQLTCGDYILVERDAPDGYNLLDSTIALHVEKDKISVIQGSSQRNDTTPDDDDFDAFITNTSGVELPHTGGSGTLPYTLGGLALICAAAMMYGFRMRRRERRLN